MAALDQNGGRRSVQHCPSTMFWGQNLGRKWRKQSLIEREMSKCVKFDHVKPWLVLYSPSLFSRENLATLKRKQKTEKEKQKRKKNNRCQNNMGVWLLGCLPATTLIFSVLGSTSVWPSNAHFFSYCQLEALDGSEGSMHSVSDGGSMHTSKTPTWERKIV